MRRLIIIVCCILFVVPLMASVVLAYDGENGDGHRTIINVPINSPQGAQIQGRGQQQQQGQSQLQGQGQLQGQIGRVETSVDSHDEFPRQAPPAIAPNLTAVPETCMGSSAVGASTPFGGVSFGTTYKSEDCELRMFARSLMALGHNAAALALLATNDNVRKALEASGVKIPSVAPKASVAPGSSSELSSTTAAFGVSVSRDPSLVVCKSSETKIRAGNGQWFCR